MCEPILIFAQESSQDIMNAFLHILHVLAAGIWLGGLVFTTIVVSPAFRQMDWSPVERIAVRSAVGRQYTKVARFNLLVLLVAALAAWLSQGWSTLASVEIALILSVVVLSELHALVWVPRLAQAARSGNDAARAAAMHVMITASMLNLLLSFGIAILSA